MSEFNKPNQLIERKTPQQFYDELRNKVLDEVTEEIQKMTGFGKDTISSFTVYIQGMKK